HRRRRRLPQGPVRRRRALHDPHDRTGPGLDAEHEAASIVAPQRGLRPRGRFEASSPVRPHAWGRPEIFEGGRLMMGTDDYDTWQQVRLALKTESEAECNAAAAGIVTFDSQIQGIVTCEDAVADEDPFFAAEEWWFDDEFCPGQATGGFPDT